MEISTDRSGVAAAANACHLGRRGSRARNLESCSNFRFDMALATYLTPFHSSQLSLREFFARSKPLAPKSFGNCELCSDRTRK